ncbi:MAG: polysaccharide deacetylase family protein [Clostridiales bacterium]|nr:polysaccharide deacetylase family protein [Clostridiales bacterium]
MNPTETDGRREAMKTKLRLAAILLAGLMLAACAKKLTADTPSETGGIGRARHDEETTAETEPTDDTAPTFLPLDNPDSSSPFGKLSWTVVNGYHVYEIPARNTSGMDTLLEADKIPKERFTDSNQPPQKDNWFPGKVSYDEATKTVTYYWAAEGSTADRAKSTLETLAKYGAIYRGDESRRVIYLTFDCGYETGATAPILDALWQKKAPATFFVTGTYVEKNVDLVGRMLNEGHLVGNHTYHHYDMTSLTASEVVGEMQLCEDAFKAAFPDAPDMLYFRPPEGSVNEWLLAIEAKLGYRTVMWSFAYDDWKEEAQPTYEEGIAAVKNGLHPGAVYLLHGESATNAAILPEFIDWVRAQGYEILPLCDIGA